ncbi:AAA domain-containing protein [Gracilibacillus salitolerans]|uniref:AAA domain-containing protein n=1 Tax=Gracilibacillus salitolerans TaxID=2663022 RepID=A0A5Q2TIH2_9BACI|nr:MoxR family ATPase [Gracilibacillus salitolerans]QGH33218.1 AAA domain-containing protein [Gracilibacillus salitolerans]
MDYGNEVAQILENIEKVMIGKEREVTLSLVALLADGHVLLEDVPGVGKTMMVRALSKSLNCDFKRIQFTPDLLPSDVTGVSIYNPKEMVFEFRSGPIFGDIVLADEINRTSPKTQSALLEAMEEMNVTVDGMTKPLNKPFFVMATQNPVDYEGTYPLPEAQLDRFLMKLSMGYPNEVDELEMLNRTDREHPIDEIEAVINKEQLLKMQKEVDRLYVDNTVKRYIVQLVSQTRKSPYVQLGVSPRGSIALMKAAKAYAYIQKRDYVIPDDVVYLAPYVLSHRVILRPEARYEGVTQSSLIKQILEEIDVPVRKELHG